MASAKGRSDDGEQANLDFNAARYNVLRFSCRRGALHQKAPKCHRSRAPKAVSCKRLLGALGSGLLVDIFRAWHVYDTCHA
jgi:hypothetical protein